MSDEVQRGFIDQIEDLFYLHPPVLSVNLGVQDAPTGVRYHKRAFSVKSAYLSLNDGVSDVLFLELSGISVRL